MRLLMLCGTIVLMIVNVGSRTLITVNATVAARQSFADFPSDGAAPLPARPSAERDRVQVSDTVWLARVIYSETKRSAEQELVAWVVRNRVETRYRGKETYRDVVLDPYQFSAFNPDHPRRSTYPSLTRETRARGWQAALQVARCVLAAKTGTRPFPETTRHFYSAQSMVGDLLPEWAQQISQVPLAVEVNPQRFRFLADIR